MSWGGGSWGEGRSRWREADPGGGQMSREAAPAWERAELGYVPGVLCNNFVRYRLFVMLLTDRVFFTSSVLYHTGVHVCILFSALIYSRACTSCSSCYRLLYTFA